MCFFFFQAEDGIRDLVRSRGLGDVYKRQLLTRDRGEVLDGTFDELAVAGGVTDTHVDDNLDDCLLYTSDAADERSSVDLGGRRIIKKKKSRHTRDAEMKQQSTKLKKIYEYN